MNSNSPWQKHFSQKNRSFYYFNVKDHSCLWVVNTCEEGWGRTLIDPKHPERGEKYVNILTNRVFYSEGELKKKVNTNEGKRIAHRGARTPDHQVKSLALYRLS